MINFIRLTLFIFGALLAIDSLALFAVQKINFGTVVPFLIGIIFLIHAMFWQRIQSIIGMRKSLRYIWRGAWVLFGLWLLSFIVFVVVIKRQINTSKTVPNVQAIIVLGAGVIDGKPKPSLASRLDSAAPIIRLQPNAVAITSGGIGFGKTLSEAHVMAIYLKDVHSIPLGRIQEEGKSTSTEENLIFSQAILQAHGVKLDAPIAIVTNDFHTVRAKAIAEKQGYQHVITVASETPLSIRFNAWFREYFAFLSGWFFGEY